MNRPSVAEVPPVPAPAALRSTLRLHAGAHLRQQGQQLGLRGAVAALQQRGGHAAAGLAQRLVQALALCAQAQAAAALVFGIGCALQPALVLQLGHHARHLGLVGAAVGNQLLLRGAGVAAHEHQRAHLIERELRVDARHGAHHVRLVHMEQVVHGLEHIGGGVGSCAGIHRA